MPKKPLNSFESLGNISFDNLAPDVELGQLINDKKILKIQNLEAHFSNKGRAGKVVTIIKGFEGDIPSLKSLAKNIKTLNRQIGKLYDNQILKNY